MTDFLVVDGSDPSMEIDWDAVDDLFGCKRAEGLDVASLLKGISLGGGEIKILLRVEDSFGWDDVILLPDGNILWDDRNTGVPILTESPPSDPDEFIKSILSLLESEG